MGASVKIFDNSIYRLKRLQNNIGVRLWTSVIEPKKILAKQQNMRCGRGLPWSGGGRKDAGGCNRRDGQQYAPGHGDRGCHRQGRVF